MNLDFITVMEWIGTVAFAVSGAVVAIEKELDYYGICFLAIITAVGGGIIRDVLVNKPVPSALENPTYAIVSLAAAIVVILFYKHIQKISHLVSVADAFGLAAFTAIGAQIGAFSGHPDVYFTITTGVLTGTFGGVLRDVFVQEIPRCFRREVYAVASIAGAVVYGLLYAEVSFTAALYTCFGVTLAVRLLAIFKKLHLGKVKIDSQKK